MNRHKYTLDNLSELTSFSKRTIRYYIQIGLLNKPFGAGRGAYYDDSHLQKIMEIKKWQDIGLSLEKIIERVNKTGSEKNNQNIDTPIPVLDKRQIFQRITLSEGIELNVSVNNSSLTESEIEILTLNMQLMINNIIKNRNDTDH